MINMADERLKTGMAALRKGDKRAARRIFGEIVRDDADNVAAWWFLAAAIDEPEQRIHCVKQVLRLRPDHVEAGQLLQSLQRHVAWPTPPEGLKRPVFDTEEIDGGLVILPANEEEAALESPRRRSSEDLVLIISLGIAFLAILGTILFTLTGIGAGFLGVQTLEEPAPTMQVLSFDIPACASNSDGLTQLVFVNNTGLTVDILQGAQGEEEPLITLSPDAQYTVEAIPDDPTRYAVRTDTPGTSGGGVVIEVPLGNVCRVPIQ
jgi:hypothetical protein